MNIKKRDVRDGRWTTKDKLNEYRRILKLYAREKKLETQDALKYKNQISLELSSLRTDVRKYRNIVNEIFAGENARTRGLLKHRKDLRLKCSRRGKVEDICDVVSRDIHTKHREVDKLRYEKGRRARRCFELQVEQARLIGEYERQQGMPRDSVQQRLITRYQQSKAKQTSAKAIHSTYLVMLDILRKDAIYHDTLLNTVKDDQAKQSKIILRATTMGQLAAEKLDDIGEKYKRMAREVWQSMKIRERSLNIARNHLEDLWAYAQSLIRTESHTRIFSSDDAMMGTISLQKQIKSLEATFDRVKESLLVCSYRELFVRLEEQTRQKARLLGQFDQNVQGRNFLLNKKNQAVALLLDVEHSLVATKARHNTDKNLLLEQIDVQSNREIECKEARKDSGKLLMAIRAALQNMVAMLICIKKGGKPLKKYTKDSEKKSAREPEEKEESEEPEEQGAKIDASELIKMDAEGLALLSNVSRKIGTLFGMSNFELDEDRKEKAKDYYCTYVSDYCSRLKFQSTAPEPTEFLVEHVALDSSVPTRTEIKLRSKHIVDAHLKLD